MHDYKNSGFFAPLVLVVFFISITTSIILYMIITNNVNKSNIEQLHHIQNREVVSLQREIDINLQVLNSIKDFYNASNNVTRDDFKIFVSEILKNFPSIQALEWIPFIPNALRAKYEENARKSLNENFNIKEKIDGKMKISKLKDSYFPVYYLEPLLGNEKALGFDLASNSTRLKSLQEAIKTKKNTATSRITLVQEKGKKFGFLVFSPIWNSENNMNIKGFVLGVYRIEDIVNKALREKYTESQLDIWLVDISDSKEELLYTNSKDKKIVQTTNYSDLNIAGKTWRFYSKANATLQKNLDSFLPLQVLILSLFISFLITYIIGLKGLKAKSLEDLVKSKSIDINTINKKLEALLIMFDKTVIASRTDKKGNITYVTTAFCQISGYSKEELMGRNHRIVRHADMSKEIYEKLWSTITSGKTFEGEIKNRKKNGSFYWVKVMISPEYDDQNNIVSYFAVREIITAKKEVQKFNETLNEKVSEEIAKNQKKDKLLIQQSKLAAMGEMIGAIAHQWRQPLNTLAMQLQFIEDDFEDGLINEEYLSNYSKESMKLVNFMSKTIDDFRNFFTIDKTKVNFDVKQKIEDTINILSSQLENHEIKLTLKGESFTVSGFPSEFQQVILNIINNSKDALVENLIKNGEIEVIIESNNSMGCIRIKDNAGGIPTDVIDRIFEPYYTTKEQGKGTGLGLYMSKMIIDDNMQGKISVENEESGAVFIIELEVSSK